MDKWKEYAMSEMASAARSKLIRLHKAVKNSDLDGTRRMLEAGEDVNAFYKNYAPLHRAANTGNVHLVQILLEHGAKIRCRDRDGRTPLHHAARSEKYGSFDICKVLLNYGANCNGRDQNGATPFHFALAYKDLRGVKLFWPYGFFLGSVPSWSVEYHRTRALHYSVANPHLDVFKFVMDQGIDIEIRTATRITTGCVCRSLSL